MSDSNNNSSGGCGCGCFSLIVFVLVVIFIYHSCNQKSFYGGAKVMKVQYDNIVNKIDTTKTNTQLIPLDTCNYKWIKLNDEWIKQCE